MKNCDYCYRNNHTREICWDFHGWPSDGRGQTDRCGDGRRGELEHIQRVYTSDKASDGKTSAFEPTMKEMITQLTSQITTLQARISSSSSGAQGYNSPSLFYLLL
jgi:hypothetical protein